MGPTLAIALPSKKNLLCNFARGWCKALRKRKQKIHMASAPTVINHLIKKIMSMPYTESDHWSTEISVVYTSGSLTVSCETHPVGRNLISGMLQK